MNTALKFAGAAVAAAIILWQGCESTNPVITQANQIVFPDANISYSQYVQPMFNISCTYSHCHDDYTQAGGLSLTSYVNANADPGNIIPYKPAQSKLCQVLEHTAPHPEPLDTIQNHIKGVHQWVLEGAKNN